MKKQDLLPGDLCKHAIDCIAHSIYKESCQMYFLYWNDLHVSDKNHYRKLARKRIEEFVMESETNKDFKKANR